MTQIKTPKILIIFAHPDLQHSVANQIMLRNIAQLDHVTVHDLYAVYPDFFIDEAAERELLINHDIIVFQHPLYMYSCPALLKEWLDRILSKGFAHGNRTALEGKYWRSVITTGGAAEAYTSEGYNRCTINDILKPFQLCADLCRMHWLPPLVLYWSRRIPDIELELHADNYYQWLTEPSIPFPILNIEQEESISG